MDYTGGIGVENNLAKDNTNICIGNRVRVRRALIGVSQEQLAEKIGVPTRTIQLIETAEIAISASALFKISKTFGVPLDYFFYNID